MKIDALPPICCDGPIVLEASAMVSVRSALRIVVVVLPVACGTGSAPQPVHPIEQPKETAAADARVDLDVTDAPLTNVLRDLAGEARINILADPDLVAIPVTVAVHSAPWNDALSTIATQQQLRVEKLEVRGAERPSFWISRQASPGAPVTTFNGDRITMRFDDTPVRDVAKALSAVAKATIVVDDDVQASITLHMRLPWDLALYHLAQKYELRIVRNGGEFRISHR